MIHLRDSLGVYGIGSVRIRDASGVHAVAKISLRDAAGLSLVYQSGGGSGTFSVVTSPQAPFGGAAKSGSAVITTEVVTVTATGGVEPYTYEWAAAETDAAWTINVLGPGLARFTRIAVAAGDSWTADFTCSVTDSAGRKVDAPAISATVTNYGGRSAPL